MRLGIFLLAIGLFVVLCLGSAAYMIGEEASDADRCRAAGGVLVETVDFSNGTICVRLEPIAY